MASGADRECDDTALNISFSGCGFLGIYHVGVIQCLRENAPSLIPRFKVVAGASAGAIASLVLLSNCPAERVCRGFIETSEASRNHWLGALSTSFDIMTVLTALFDDLLPPNAHRQCQGRLQISLTAVPGLKNVMVSNFNTRLELIKALKATCYIPVWAGVKKHTYRGKTYMDGGISNNMPADFPGQTITVSPFSGEADICPRDQREGWDMSLNISGTSVRMTLANVFRMKSALFPPDPSVLERIYQGGYRDCLRFLEQRGWMETAAHAPPTCIPGYQVQRTDTDRIPSQGIHFPLVHVPREYFNGARELLTGMSAILKARASSGYSKVVSPSLVYLLAVIESLVQQAPVSCLQSFYSCHSHRRQLSIDCSPVHFVPAPPDTEPICLREEVLLEGCAPGEWTRESSSDSGIAGGGSPLSPIFLSDEHDIEDRLFEAIVRY